MEPVHFKDDNATDIDIGPPIQELAAFEYPAPEGFLKRIRRAIDRRATASQLALFAVDAPALILQEGWRLILGLFTPTERKDLEK